MPRASELQLSLCSDALLLILHKTWLAGTNVYESTLTHQWENVR